MELEKSVKQLKAIIISLCFILIINLILTSTLFDKVGDNEDSIFFLEMIEITENNNINSTTISQFSDNELGVICNDILTSRFSGRCTDSLLSAKKLHK